AARDAPRARRARPPPRLPPLPRLHLAPGPHRLSRRRARRALPRALGTRTHLRRGQDAHPRARGGAAQSGPDPRRAGSVGLAARLQPPPPRDEPRRPARGRAAAAPELSPRAPRLLAHGLALAAWRPAAPPRGAARRTRALRAPGAPAAPLPARRQDQDEQLSA